MVFSDLPGQFTELSQSLLYVAHISTIAQTDLPGAAVVLPCPLQATCSYLSDMLALKLF